MQGRKRGECINGFDRSIIKPDRTREPISAVDDAVASRRDRIHIEMLSENGKSLIDHIVQIVRNLASDRRTEYFRPFRQMEGHRFGAKIDHTLADTSRLFSIRFEYADLHSRGTGVEREQQSF